MTGQFPAQRAIDAESISMAWCYHQLQVHSSKGLSVSRYRGQYASAHIVSGSTSSCMVASDANLSFEPPGRVEPLSPRGLLVRPLGSTDGLSPALNKAITLIIIECWRKSHQLCARFVLYRILLALVIDRFYPHPSGSFTGTGAMIVPLPVK